MKTVAIGQGRDAFIIRIHGAARSDGSKHSSVERPRGAAPPMLTLPGWEGRFPDGEGYAADLFTAVTFSRAIRCRSAPTSWPSWASVRPSCAIFSPARCSVRG